MLDLLSDMNTVIETITSVEGQIAEAVETVQQPVVDAVSRIVELVEGFLPEDRPSVPFADALPTPAELIDTQYAFARRMLDIQHGFVKSLIDAVAPLYAEQVTPAPVKSATAKTSKAA
jgi:hypothetical protein